MPSLKSKLLLAVVQRKTMQATVKLKLTSGHLAGQRTRTQAIGAIMHTKTTGSQASIEVSESKVQNQVTVPKSKQVRV